jgi:hypothetical protein
MPPLGYRIVLGHGLRIEVERPNGARALIVGTLDSIPIAAGGEALHLVICNATVTDDVLKGGPVGCPSSFATRA